MRLRLVGTVATACCACLWLMSGARRPPAGEAQHKRRPLASRAYPPTVRAPQRRCRWDVADPPLPPERNSSRAAVVQQLVEVLEGARLALGYEYTLVDGTLLGAVRHHGLIPGDTDVDAVLLLHPGETLGDVRASLGEHLARAGEPLRLEEADDGHTQWLRLQPWQQDPQSITAGRPLVADLLLLPSALLRPSARLRPRRTHSRARRTWGRAAFEGLCRCTFYGPATCFEAAPRLLASLYGDFWEVSGRHATGRDGQQRNVLEEMEVVAGEESGEAASEVSTRPAASRSTPRPPSPPSAHAPAHASAARAGDDEWCHSIRASARVVPGESWGGMSLDEQQAWMHRACDRFFCQPNPMRGRGRYRCVPMTRQP
jgi:hypothetical protein